nr:helix-hairpin-helix domain-containing protein [uncultured Carboxylicivirga sp.]
MWRDFLTLSKKEQTSMFSLFLLLLLLIVFLFIKPTFVKHEANADLQAWVDSIVQNTSINSKKNSDIEFFTFNPNSVSEDELLSLGFSKYAAGNLLKYRNAGGVIRSFEKLSQVYGMDSNHLQKIKPYIVYPSNNQKRYQPVETNTGFKYRIDLNMKDSAQLMKLKINQAVVEDIIDLKRSYYFNQRVDVDLLRGCDWERWNGIKDTLLFKKQTNRVVADEFQIELNSADTAELALLKGVGKVLSRRIVYYRNRLGGFYDLNQLNEVEGISPIVLADNKSYIIIDTLLVQKININRSSLRRMKNHPYMNFYQAKDIYENRKKSEVSLSEIIEFESFRDADMNRIRRYFIDKE